jgi:hypothetical protein
MEEIKLLGCFWLFRVTVFIFQKSVKEKVKVFTFRAQKSPICIPLDHAFFLIMNNWSPILIIRHCKIFFEFRLHLSQNSGIILILIYFLSLSILSFIHGNKYIVLRSSLFQLSAQNQMKRTCFWSNEFHWSFEKCSNEAFLKVNKEDFDVIL